MLTGKHRLVQNFWYLQSGSSPMFWLRTFWRSNYHSWGKPNTRLRKAGHQCGQIFGIFVQYLKRGLSIFWLCIAQYHNYRRRDQAEHQARRGHHYWHCTVCNAHTHTDWRQLWKVGQKRNSSQLLDWGLSLLHSRVNALLDLRLLQRSYSWSNLILLVCCVLGDCDWLWYICWSHHTAGWLQTNAELSKPGQLSCLSSIWESTPSLIFLVCVLGDCRGHIIRLGPPRPRGGCM